MSLRALRLVLFVEPLLLGDIATAAKYFPEASPGAILTATVAVVALHLTGVIGSG